MSEGLGQSEIDWVVNRVVERLMNGATAPQTPSTGTGAVAAGAPRFTAPAVIPVSQQGRLGLFPTITEAVTAARAAQKLFVEIPLEKRKKIIAECRRLLTSHVEELSRLAVEETGLGRVEDKRSKNQLVIDKTPGVECLEPRAFTGDDGLCLIEYAPYGVIGSITPTTNPSETVINNGLGMIAAGNAVVFNPHPSAKRVSNRTVELFNQAILSCGGPPNVVCSIIDPTIETASELMKADGVRLLVVTGGPAVVKAAMNSGKKVIAAGPGNPPVVVDETADLDQAAKGIIAGASLDNNIVCIAEKEIIVVEKVADALIAALKKHGAFELSTHQIRRLEPIVIDGKYPNKKFVGKNANVILREIGVEVGDEVRLVFGEVTDENHPFMQVEMLMPVLPLIRVKNVGEAIDMAKRVEHGFCHTAVMYSKNIDNLHRMACEVNTSIFVKNAPSYAGLSLGGEGFTSFTIASPTGEGLTTAVDFSRVRRCTLKEHFRIV
jgi:acyl-CoA reductase-like NAD-dependent aldehyde dehydrogenase